MTSLISVVIPTRNNMRTIRACLASVREQTHTPIELIVVDNHSTDGTEVVAGEFADKVMTAGPERSAQRNRGVEEATGEWVLWLDSDMVLPPRALEAALEAVSRGADAVALPERTIGSGYWTRCRALERACYLDQPSLHNPRLVRRSYLRSAGFHVGMSGPEDADLRMRMRADGTRIELADIVIDHDEGRLTIADVLRKRYYYGRSIPVFADAHDGAVSDQSRDILRSYAKHRGELLRDPVHSTGMVVMRGLEVVGYAFGARRGRRERRKAAQ